MQEMIRAVAFSMCFASALTACAEFSACGLHECSPDAKISADVRTLLADHPDLGGSNRVSVQTMHGVVYLSGLVSTPYQVAEAGGIAEQVPGVTNVQNLVVVENSR